MSKKRTILLIALAVSFVLAYLPVWKDLVSAWYSSDDYSHGFFILPIVIYAIWQRREQLRKLQVGSSRFGIVLLGGSLLLYILAIYAEVKTIASLTLVFALAGMVLYLYGPALFRELAFLFFLLLFMIPVPDQIYSALTIPLQLIVTDVSVWLSMLIGLPIFRSGNVIYLPEHTLAVVEACSGLRSLMSLLTLSVVLAYFTLRSTGLRMILVFSGVPAAIAVNVFRVLIMILAFSYFDLDLTQGLVHTIFGIAVFGLALALVLLVRRVLSLWDIPITEK